jgi:hypothetical protein
MRPRKCYGAALPTLLTLIRLLILTFSHNTNTNLGSIPSKNTKQRVDLEQAVSAHGLAMRIKDRLERQVVAAVDERLRVEAQAKEKLLDVSVLKRDLTKKMRQLDIDRSNLIKARSGRL